MFQYPARVERDGSSFLVTFRDIPEALTEGESLEHALEMAVDALTTAMDFYVEDRRMVPSPSPLVDGEYPVKLPTSAAAKILLLNEMVKSGIRNAELARLMNVRPQEVSRLTDLHHSTKIDTIADALHALGKSLELRVD